jgi:hypothetical protein
MNQIHAQPFSVIWERLTKQAAPVVNRPGILRAGTAYVVAQQPDGYLAGFTGNFTRFEKDSSTARRRAP